MTHTTKIFHPIGGGKLLEISLTEIAEAAAPPAPTPPAPTPTPKPPVAAPVQPPPPAPAPTPPAVPAPPPPAPAPPAPAPPPLAPTPPPVSAPAPVVAKPPLVGGTYVRPAGAAPLLGMNIGAKNYDESSYVTELARLDTVVVGFYPGWKGDRDGSVIRRTVQAMKARNPSLKVAQYTVLNESTESLTSAHKDKAAKLNETNWWLRDAATGAKLQWTTAYGQYDVNQTEWVQADANGDRWPQWLAKRDHRLFFKPVPEFDIWYFDNVMKNSRVDVANWKLDGANVSSTDPTVAAAYRRGHAAEWEVVAALSPNLPMMGNVDNDLSAPEFKGQLHAAFLEALFGKSYSIERWAGWLPAMQHYFTTTANLREPRLIGFNVHGKPTDYKFFRYAFTSCLLGNGQFSFTDIAVGYSSVPWFDEYEVSFGAAVDTPTLTAWSNGVHRRRYEKAMVLVNPQVDARTVTIEPGWRRVRALQDAVTNNGETVTTVTLPPKDGLVLVKV